MTKELYAMLERCEGRAGFIFTARLRTAIRRALAIEYNKGRQDKASELRVMDRRKGLAYDATELEGRYT